MAVRVMAVRVASCCIMVIATYIYVVYKGHPKVLVSHVAMYVYFY